MWNYLYLIYSVSSLYFIYHIKQLKNTFISINHHNIKLLISNNEICPICIEGFNKNDAIVVPKCGHIMHMDCYTKQIQSNYKTKNKCSQCNNLFFELEDNNSNTNISLYQPRYHVSRVYRRLNITSHINTIDPFDDIDIS